VSRAQLPKGWKITGWGPLYEGVEATGPDGQKVIAPTEEGLPKAIRAQGGRK
jgi:hypothetical protein